jgi:MSHA biogenesis protein MshG
MPSFTYKGRNSGGQLIEGVLEGATSGAVADTLLGQGLIPVEIHEAKAKAKSGGGMEITLFKPRVTHIDILLFSRQIHTLLKAGVPIMRALGGLQEAAINPAMKSVIQDIRESLEGGRELSAGLARHPRVFSPFYLSMVKVGEMTGLLEEIFMRLFDHLEFERYMREQVKSALRYPSFVVMAMAAAIVVVNLFVIPAFAKVFAGFGAELPLMTRLLLGFSEFMTTYWMHMLAALAATVFAFRSWVATVKGRHDWEGIALRIPIAGKILHKAALSRFARSFALGMRSGVPVMQALSNSAQTVDNTYIARRIENMRDGVERGESILRSAITVGIFTPVVLQMIAVGEESGAVDDMMEEIGGMYQQEVEYELKTLGQQIEPILIVALGILVLILALGIFLPMWDLGKVAIKH